MKNKKIKPLNNQVLVRFLEPEEETASGIIMPGKKSEKNKGIVIEKPDKIKDIKKGDEVFINEHRGEEIELDGKLHTLIDFSDILAIIE